MENVRPPFWFLWLGCIIANGMMIVLLFMDDIPESEVPDIQKIVHSRFYM